MSQLPLNAFAQLTEVEIQHIIDVMRHAAIDEDAGEQTIKRQPTRSNDENNNDTLQRQTSSSTGIPSVPRVHMGAGFTKIFNRCPLTIRTSSSWTNPETKRKFDRSTTVDRTVRFL
jgi:hypothetical protein